MLQNETRGVPPNILSNERPPNTLSLMAAPAPAEDFNFGLLVFVTIVAAITAGLVVGIVLLR
jgi:hypothetical protein